MRTAFIEQLITEARINPKLFLITGDLGFSVLEPFAKEFPDRFLNAGVAEQNMTGIAAGLAMEGFTVFTYSIANFPTLRAMEQIRYDICYHNLDVKIVAVGGGYAYASLGASHHATEEIGMLRTIPNLEVCAPGDPYEAKAITTYACTEKGPLYIRLGKAGEPSVHKAGIHIKQSDAFQLIKGNRRAILSTGSMLKYAYDFINENSTGDSLYSFPFIKPVNKQLLKKISSEYELIITLEEHQRSCGFGSAILEAMNDLREEGVLQDIPSLKRIAIPDTFYSVAGSQDYLRKIAGLTL